MTKHPRAADLTRLIEAVERAGKPVSAVEVQWREIDGRETPVWVLRFGGESGKVEEPVKWD